MPFGIQLKGFIIGLVFAYFVMPWVLGLVNRARSGRDAA